MKLRNIKVAFGSDTFTCTEFYNNDESSSGVHVTKGKKSIGMIYHLLIPKSNDKDYQTLIPLFNKAVEKFLDENYY